MVLDNKAFFRAGSRLLTAVPLLPDTTAVDGASEGASMHLVNVYKFGDEVAGHKVGPVWVWMGGRYALLLLAHFPSALHFPKAQSIGRFTHAECWPMCREWCTADFLLQSWTRRSGGSGLITYGSCLMLSRSAWRLPHRVLLSRTCLPLLPRTGVLQLLALCR